MFVISRLRFNKAIWQGLKEVIKGMHKNVLLHTISKSQILKTIEMSNIQKYSYHICMFEHIMVWLKIYYYSDIINNTEEYPLTCQNCIQNTNWTEKQVTKQ